MSIFCAEVSWSVSIYIFCVKISTSHKKSLDNPEVASDACDMEWGPEVFGSRVNQRAIFDQYLNKLDMTFTCSHMKRSPAISVGAVDANLCLILCLWFENLKTSDLVAHLNSQPQLPCNFLETFLLRITLRNPLWRVNIVVNLCIFILTHVFVTVVNVRLLRFHESILCFPLWHYLFRDNIDSLLLRRLHVA